VEDVNQKPATSARMYDYYLGGVHNFPADREAAKIVAEMYPFIPAAARANRAFLGRAVRTLADSGVRQFLDLGSGIPTAGNVHEIAQAKAPDARVAYVDIDPVAVSESQELLRGNANAVALLADLRDPAAVLDHPAVRKLLDLNRPVGVLLVSVLHFVLEDEQAYGTVEHVLNAVPSGSYLVVSHVAAESFAPINEQNPDREDVYRRRTATPGTTRVHAEVTRFFAGLDLLEPGVVRVDEWRPEPGEPGQSDPERYGAGMWAGVARKP